MLVIVFSRDNECHVTFYELVLHFSAVMVGVHLGT